MLENYPILYFLRVKRLQKQSKYVYRVRQGLNSKELWSYVSVTSLRNG